MNNLKCYIDMEKELGAKGVGDYLEASQVLSDIEFKMFDQETGVLALSGKSSRLNFRIDGDEKKPVYCLFALHSEYLNIVDENDEFYITEMNFSDNEVDKMIDEFGEQLLIIDPNSFMERLDKVFAENGYVYVAAKVNYDDYSINSQRRLESYVKNINEVFFWKDKYFENQKEYRVVITNLEIDKPLEVNIGNINDISKKYNARKLFSGSIQIHLRK